jgi:tRNA U34 5-carboxymethylaminomethyl modifying enzyme MnmG/GidA
MQFIDGTPIRDTYDVIVIGAGLGGMTTANATNSWAMERAWCNQLPTGGVLLCHIGLSQPKGNQVS